MKHCHIHRRGFLASSLALTGAIAMPGSALASGPLVLVVGPNSKLKDIDSDKLRRIFLSRPTPSPDAARFIPLNHRKSDTARINFDRAVLELEPDEVQRYWVDQKIRGVKPPRTVSSEAIAQLLSGVPGTICYVPASAVGDLRALSIDGQAPGSEKYLLR